MKRSVSALCLLASALTATGLAQSTDAPSAPAPAMAASSAPAGPSKVAVIMFEAAVAQTNEGQRDIGQIKQKFDPKQAQLKNQSDEIESLKKSLQTSGTSLSDAEKANRTKAIDQKEKALQRDAEAAQSDFNSEMNDMLQSLAQKVYNTVQTYAAQNGYNIVLDASGGQQQQPVILWANEGANITAAVVQAYNAKSGIAAPAGAAAPTTGSGATTRTPSSAPRSTTPRPATKPQ